MGLCLLSDYWKYTIEIYRRLYLCVECMHPNVHKNNKICLVVHLTTSTRPIITQYNIIFDNSSKWIGAILLEFMMFNATFSNISAISWKEYPEKTTDLPQVTDKRYHTMLYRIDLATSRIRNHNFVNYHTITTTTVPSTKIV